MAGIPDFVRENAVDVTEKSVAALMSDALIQILIVCVPFFAFGFVVTALISVIQVGWKVTGKPLQPKFDKFNPINGFKRIFSKDSIFELIKSILKIFVIIYVAYTSIRGNAQDIFILYEIPLMPGDHALRNGDHQCWFENQSRLFSHWSGRFYLSEVSI